ncbi:MAG: endonuclease/exonuclease/phosphatase family protein [Gammaproteobacteria bacterium]|nr:endonuclease/exonuclease/phosphatase family protein [Gammaproteobacteria bacterium]
MNLKRFISRTLFVIFLFIIVLLIFLIQPVQRFQETKGLIPAKHTSENSFIVSIWNLHNQNSILGNDNNTVIQNQFSDTSLKESDIIALQEVTSSGKIKAMTDQYGFKLYGARDAILTKRAVVNNGTVVINQYGRTAFWSDIQITPEKILRLYSVHLSYKIARSPFIEEQRGEEINELLKHAESFSGPVIIAGDFNTITVFKADIKNIPVLKNFYTAGFSSSRPIGACNSHIPLGEQDWIFVKNLKPVRYVCGNYAGSDHRWIQAELSFK